jgi:polyisoprenoid-binding protein YceI
MKKTFLLILLTLSLLVSACSGASTTVPQPTATQVQPAATSIPTEPAPTATQPPPTAEATTEPTSESKPAPATDVVTFQIIPGDSQVSYEVGEVFLNQNNAFKIAIGVTTQVSGEVSIDRSNPQNSSIGPISVDISQFTSDSNRRDNAIRNNWLESALFPIATFVPTQITGLPASGEEGEDYKFQVTGDLTVREITLPVTFEVTATLVGDTLTGEASTTILMSSYQVGPISIAGILNTEDEVKIEFNFVARSAAGS